MLDNNKEADQLEIGKMIAKDCLLAIALTERISTAVLQNMYGHAINMVTQDPLEIKQRKKIKALLDFSKKLDAINGIKESPLLNPDGSHIVTKVEETNDRS